MTDIYIVCFEKIQINQVTFKMTGKTFFVIHPEYLFRLQLFCLFLFYLISLPLTAQRDSSWQQKPLLNLEGYADIFYLYDWNRPSGEFRQPFLFNYNRHNEFNLNLGFLKLSADHQRYRANIALQAGTYANDNYVAEPGVLKNVLEANIGISLRKQNNLWLDAGIFPAHIGFESAIALDNWTMTRSLSAECSPYFLTGTKLSWQLAERWQIAGLLVNGWQRIQRVRDNSRLSLGTQISYTTGPGMTLNWSTFAGTDDPDSTRRMRYFSNLYGQFELHKRAGLILGFDIGFQEQQAGSAAYHHWYIPVIIGRYTISEHWKIAVRAEYVNDRNSVIVPAPAFTGFRTTGLSCNADYAPADGLLCRTEVRWFSSPDQLFRAGDTFRRQSFFAGASLLIRFSSQWQDNK